jgi:hypothetical protein
LILEIIFAVIAGHASDRGFGARPVVFEPAATAMTPASSRSDSSIPAIAKNLKGVTAKTPPSSIHGECSLLAARVFDLLGRGMGMPPGSGLSIKP